MTTNSVLERALEMQKEAESTYASAEHYRELFKPGDYADKVIADLAIRCGYFTTLPDDATNEQLRAHNAKRQIFESILNLSDLNSARLDGIQHQVVRTIEAAKARANIQG